MKRLFLVFLICASSIFSFGETAQSSLGQLVNEQVKAKFLDDGYPLRYYSNILIRLNGNPTKEDSAIFREMVDTLNILTDKWDVYIIPKGTSNLTFEINEPYRKGELNKIIEHGNHPWEIVKRTVVLNLPADLDYSSRKKVIYYYLLRSIVKIKSRERNQNFIKGSVFSEYDSQKITFHPVDFRIIKELYSEKYEKRTERISTVKMSPEMMQRFLIRTLFNLLAFLISFSFLIFMSVRGKFSNHNYSFLPFLKQGFLVVTAGAIYIVMIAFISVTPLQANLNLFFIMPLIILVLFAVGFVVISLIFLLERAILKNRSSFYLEIIVPFLSLTLILPIFFLSFSLSVSPNSPAFIVYFSSLSGGVLFFLLTGFGRSIYIYTRKKSESIIRKKDLELAKLSEQQKQAELQSLRAKINPHFLYNSLNSIASLSSTNPQKTEQMALALSDFFKYVINREQKQLNTLSEELNATRTYLEIEKVRFGDRLNFEIDYPAEFLDVQIPQLIIQPLVENAIKHGLSQITGKGTIQISVRTTEGKLKIRIYDNGPAFPDGPLSGFGIRNTQERIFLSYGDQASVNWENGTEKYIEISLPFTISNLPVTH